MEQKSWLEKTLDNETKRLFLARQVLKKNPHSYSAKVALQSAEHRLEDLKQRMKNESTNLNNSASTR